MDTLEIMKSLNDASKLLNAQRHAVAKESLAIWQKVDHALGYIDRQLAQLMKEEVSA